MKTIFLLFVLVTVLPSTSRPQPTWDQVGPYGGYVRSLAKDGNGNIFAGTFLGGIFKSTNNGTSWVQVYADTLKADFRSVAVNSSGHIFGGTAGFGIQRSTDAGATWLRLSGFLFTSTVQALMILPNDDIIAGSFDGVFRSTNNGASFSYISTGLTNTTIYAIAANGSGHLFAATAGDGVFRSTNAGANWSPINTGIDANDLFVYGLGVKAGNEIWAASGKKLYRSTNNGDNWSPLLPVPLAGYSSVVFAPNGDAYAAATSINNASGGGVFKSTNSGTTWTQEPELPNIPHYALVTSGSMIFDGTEGPGVYNSSTTLSPQNTWALGVNGMTNTHVYVLAKGTDSTLYAGTRFAGVFKSTDGGLTWFSASSGLPHDWINAIAVNPLNGYLFAATNSLKFRSTNNGATWQQIHTVGGTAMKCNSQGNLFAGFGSQVAKSTNNGTSWIFSNLFPVVNIAEIVFDRDTVYVATGNIGGITGQGVYRLTNNGGTWAAFNTGLTNLNVTTVAVGNPPPGWTIARPPIVCGTKQSGLFRLDTTQTAADSFEEWELATVPPGNTTKVAPRDGVTFLLLVTARLFGWDPYDDPYEVGYSPPQPKAELNTVIEIVVPTLHPGGTGSVFLIGTNGVGIHRSNIFISNVGGTSSNPDRFLLEQNYPNPFNPSTRIVYRVKSRELVSLKVFDVLGREVATLVDGMKEAGEHSVTLDGSTFSSGVYFYRLHTSEFTQTKKLVLLR